VVPFDDTAGYTTGIALVNWSSQPAIIGATIRDEGGSQIDLQAVTLPAMGHTSFNIPDRFPAAAGRRGVIELQNTAGRAVVTGVGLRFSPNGTFTSVPVVFR